jgi:hypothetical protein
MMASTACRYLRWFMIKKWGVLGWGALPSPERGQGSGCLLLIAVGIHTSKPPTLVRLNLTSEHALGCVVCLARHEADLTGGEVGCHGEDCHLSFVVDVDSLQARGAVETPLVCGLEIAHHLVHLVCIDGARIPAHPITGLDEMATDLPVSHAANELLPRGLVITAELYTRLGGVVQELIVADPQGGVPSFVGCPTVVSGEGAGHVVVCCVDVVSLQGQAAMADPMWTVCRVTSAQSYSSFSWAHLASAADLQSHREQWSSDS